MGSMGSFNRAKFAIGQLNKAKARRLSFDFKTSPISARLLDANLPEHDGEYLLRDIKADSPVEEDMADTSCKVQKKLTLEKIIKMELRLKEKYPVLEECGSPAEFRLRCDDFLKRYQEKRSKRKEKRLQKKEKLRVEVELRRAEEAATPVVREQSPDIFDAVTPVQSPAKHPDLPNYVKCPVVSTLYTPKLNSDTADVPVSRDGGDPAVTFAIKKKFPRPNRRKKEDASTQTADIPEQFKFELSEMNREHLLHSPPVVYVPKKKARKMKKKTNSGVL